MSEHSGVKKDKEGRVWINVEYEEVRNAKDAFSLLDTLRQKLILAGRLFEES